MIPSFRPLFSVLEDGASHVNIVAFAWMVEWLLSRAKSGARAAAAAAADKDKWRGKSAP